MEATTALTVRLVKAKGPRRHWNEVSSYEVIVNGQARGIVTSAQTSTSAPTWSGRLYGSSEILSGFDTRKSVVAALLRRIEA